MALTLVTDIAFGEVDCQIETGGRVRIVMQPAPPGRRTPEHLTAAFEATGLFTKGEAEFLGQGPGHARAFADSDQNTDGLSAKAAFIGNLSIMTGYPGAFRPKGPSEQHPLMSLCDFIVADSNDIA